MCEKWYPEKKSLHSSRRKPKDPELWLRDVPSGPLVHLLLPRRELNLPAAIMQTEASAEDNVLVRLSGTAWAFLATELNFR